MTFIQFIFGLPLGDFTFVLLSLLGVLVLLGIYKFVKDWLPW